MKGMRQCHRRHCYSTATTPSPDISDDKVQSALGIFSSDSPPLFYQNNITIEKEKKDDGIKAESLNRNLVPGRASETLKIVRQFEPQRS